MQVSEQLIWKLIRNNNFPAKTARLGVTIRIERASWNAFLENGSGSTQEKAPAPRRGRPPKPAPPLDLQRQRELSQTHVPQ